VTERSYLTDLINGLDSCGFGIVQPWLYYWLGVAVRVSAFSQGRQQGPLTAYMNCWEQTHITLGEPE
jgi:hypothetical protein